MTPSAKKRDRVLFLSSPKILTRGWILVAIVMSCVLVPIDFFAAKASHFTFGKTLVVILASVGGMFLVALFGIFLAHFIFSRINKETIAYSVNTQNRISFHELCRQAESINQDNVPWYIETHEEEGWIDVTWRWKDSLDVNAFLLSPTKNNEVFYKFFKFYDDFTYDDLDMLTSVNFSPNLKSIHYSKSTQMGHLKSKQFHLTVGVDSKDGLGIHEYRLDTTEMTNFMHKWFADHGYQYRGLS